MTTKLLYLISIVLVLVGCTKESEPILDQAIDQNETNINQLKGIAEKSGWSVSPKVADGNRETPLTKEEIKDFQQTLNEYSLYPQTQEKREVEIVPVGNEYIPSLIFAPRLETKAYSSGSVTVNATFGFCVIGTCDKIPIKVCYDLNETGSVMYAFGGSASSIDASKGVACSWCGKLVYTSTIYYECNWSGDTVYLKLWLNQMTYWYSSNVLKHLMSVGSVNIKSGSASFETREVSEHELPPFIFN